MADFLARLALGCALTTVALVVALAGFGFLCAALYLALLPIGPPPLAALLTGIAVILVALLLIVAARLIGRPAKAASARGGGGTAQPEVMTRLGLALGQEAQALVRGHAKEATLAAMVIGFALGVSPRLRRRLWRVLQ